MVRRRVSAARRRRKVLKRLCYPPRVTQRAGASVDNNGQMGQDAISAIIATKKQLSNLGINAQIGVTPMIGVNDIASEVFKLSDAQALLNYAQSDPKVAEIRLLGDLPPIRSACLKRATRWVPRRSAAACAISAIGTRGSDQGGFSALLTGS